MSIYACVCVLQVRSWSLCNCVTGLTQQGCVSLPTISHRRCSACQTEEAVSGWATSSPQLEGDFTEPGKPLQIGRRRAAPLPPSSLLRGLGSAYLKGERRREPWHLNGGGETCCSPFESLRVGGLTSDGEGPQGLQEVSLAKGSTPPFRDVPLEQAGTAASSTLHLSETNVTPAVVFDNTARARLTGRRHNGTNRRASQDTQTCHNFK